MSQHSVTFLPAISYMDICAMSPSTMQLGTC